MLRKALIGGGGTVTTIAIGLFASGWPEHIRAHPVVVVSIALIGIVAMGVGIFSGQHKEKPAQSIKTGRDNTGSQYSAGRDLHVHETAKEQGQSIPPEPLLDPAFTIRPRLTYIAYELSPGCWKECPQDCKGAKRALIVEATRELPPPKQKTKHSVSVLAVLKFTCVGSEQVPRAYWLNLQGYLPSFVAGHAESLIVATYEEPFFASYTNPKLGDLMEDQFHIPYRDLGPKTTMPAISFAVEISLFDWYEHKTIQQNKVTAEFADKDFVIKGYS